MLIYCFLLRSELGFQELSILSNIMFFCTDGKISVRINLPLFSSTPTRPVENVVITTKGLQDRNNQLLDGRTVENKGKLILIKTKTICIHISLFTYIDISIILLLLLLSLLLLLLLLSMLLISMSKDLWKILMFN